MSADRPESGIRPGRTNSAGYGDERPGGSLGEGAANLLFPPSCPGCGRRLLAWRPPYFCSRCRARIRYIVPPLCSCCGLPLTAGGDHLCGDCLRSRFVFSRARAAVIYAEPVISPLLAFKYRGEMSLLAPFGALARPLPAEAPFGEPELIVPVPLHPRRLRARGFNQALLLSRSFFPTHKSRINPDLLLRIRHTDSQRGRSGRERRRNLRGAFRVAGKEKVAGKTVLLIDDVFTTGTTVNECAATLLTAGAAEVAVFTLARTVRDFSNPSTVFPEVSQKSEKGKKFFQEAGNGIIDKITHLRLFGG